MAWGALALVVLVHGAALAGLVWWRSAPLTPLQSLPLVVELLQTKPHTAQAVASLQRKPLAASVKAPAPMVAPLRTAVPAAQVPADLVPAFSVPAVADLAAPSNLPSVAAYGPQAAPGTSPQAVASAAPPLPPSAPRLDADYLDNPAPVYPPVSRRSGEAGRVVLRVYVEPTGHASRLEVRSSSGFARLDQSALSAVGRWRFVPARQGAEPVGGWVQVPIVFSLKG